jgi:hypothetical protein
MVGVLVGVTGVFVGMGSSVLEGVKVGNGPGSVGVGTAVTGFGVNVGGMGVVVGASSGTEARATRVGKGCVWDTAVHPASPRKINSPKNSRQNWPCTTLTLCKRSNLATNDTNPTL